MWRPKLRRQAHGRTKQGWNFAFTPEFLDWKAPNGVVTPSPSQITRLLDAVPARIDWDWARGRLLPVLERPGAEPFPESPYLSSSAECGVSFGFGINHGPIFIRVNQGMADMWESSVEQVRDAAFDNLRRITSALTQSDVIRGRDEADGTLVLSAIDRPEGCATSLLLISDELRRLFGSDDQVFTTPSRSVLLSFPLDVDFQTVAVLTTHFEELDPHPLLLDPFVLEGGELRFDADP